MGTDVAVAHITSAPYCQSVDSEANKRCVSNFRKRVGPDEVTNMCWEEADFQTHLLADAMRKADGGNVMDLLRILPGSEFSAPQGQVKIDEFNHHAYLHPRIGRVNASGQFDILQESQRWVRPDPYLVSHTIRDWSNNAQLHAR